MNSAMAGTGGESDDRFGLSDQPFAQGDFAGWVSGGGSTQMVLVALREARRRFPDKSIEDRVFLEDLIRTILRNSFGEILGDLEDPLSESVADTLLEDPTAAERLRLLWERAGEVAG